MKTFSFTVPMRHLAGAVLGMAVALPHAWAETPAAKSGQVSTELAKNLLCNTAQLLQGDIGLLLGLSLVFLGLWSLIQGSKIASALPMLIVGALITALPTLVMSAAVGLGNLLTSAKISKSDTSKFISDAFSGANAHCPVPTALPERRHQNSEQVPGGTNSEDICDTPSGAYLTQCQISI